MRADRSYIFFLTIYLNMFLGLLTVDYADRSGRYKIGPSCNDEYAFDILRKCSFSLDWQCT